MPPTVHCASTVQVASSPTFAGAVPLWLEMQSRAVVLAAAGLGCVVLLHLAGGTIRAEGRRLVVSPRVRGHVAILLAGLGLALAWGSSLEPLRLATGSRGPLLSSEYLTGGMFARASLTVRGFRARGAGRATTPRRDARRMNRFHAMPMTASGLSALRVRSRKSSTNFLSKPCENDLPPQTQ